MARKKSVKSDIPEIELSNIQEEEQQQEEETVVEKRDIVEIVEKPNKAEVVIPEIKEKSKPIIIKESKVRVKILNSIDRLFVGGKLYSFKEGDIIEVPEQVAILLRSDKSAI